MARPKETIDPRIGQKIKVIRKRMNVTQEEFAEHYNKTVQTVQNWENGRRKVPDEVIQNLAESLNIDPEYIKGNNSDPLFQETLQLWDQEYPDAGKEFRQYEKFVAYIEDLTGETVEHDQDLSNIKQEVDDFIIFKISQNKERK